MIEVEIRKSNVQAMRLSRQLQSTYEQTGRLMSEHARLSAASTNSKPLSRP